MEKKYIKKSGFKYLSEAKRFSKMYALLIMYQISQIDSDVNTEAGWLTTSINRDWAYKELLKLNIPNGFQYLGSFDEALKWFLKNCRK